MVTLKLFNEDVIDSDGNLIPVNSIELYHRITVLSGCSGSGKTFLYSNLESAEINADGWSFECNKNIKLLSNLRDLTDYISKTDWLIIIDEEIAQEAIRRHMMDEMKKSSNYFLLITRGILYTQTNVRAMLELKDSKLSPINGTRLFDTVYTFKLKDSNVKADNNRLKYLITKDTASGKIFWDRLFPNVTLVTLIN